MGFNDTRYVTTWPGMLTSLQVEKLMSNPEREVRLPVPQGPFANELLARMPKDIIKSVSGSAAAAGSGEFHVYKNSRRREFERVKLMEEQQRAVSDADMTLSLTDSARRAEGVPGAPSGPGSRGRSEDGQE